MNRLPFDELERRCQKPDHRLVGNWMARNVSRPAALQVTQIIAPWGVSAHMATLVAWGFGLGAAAALGWGTIWGWIIGAVMLQTWYLFDHVDGQLARLRGTASLDGVQLDYMMHHTINLVVPLGIGWGLFARTSQPLWAAAGLLYGLSLLLLTLHHDARSKAFIKRLKRVHGRLEVIGGGVARPEPQPPMPGRPLRLAAWLARKACEPHVIVNLLAVIAIAQLALGDGRLIAGSTYLALMAPTAAAVTGWTIVRSQQQGTTEREFAAWFRPSRGEEIVFLDGWWFVRPAKEDCATGE